MRKILYTALLAAALVGCAARREWKEGMANEEAGRDWAAAQDYLMSLRHNPNFAKAQDGLWRVAPHAYELQLDRAAEAEQARDWDKAIAEYKKLGEFGRAALAFGAEVKEIDAAAKIDEIESAAAREAYGKADRAFQEKRWADALTGWKETLAYKADYKDTNARIGATHAAWAREELAAKSWRAAAERFLEATKYPESGDAKAQAAGIYAALGKYFLDQKQCRQAVRDLTAATGLTADATVKKNLGLAESCALVTLAVTGVDNPTGVANVGGVAIGPVVGDAIQARMTSTGSDFVRVLAPSAAGVRYKASARLTQVKLDGPTDTKTPGSTKATIQEPCTVTDATGAQVESKCPKEVTITFVDHKGKVRVRLAGSAKLVDTTAANKEVGSRAFDLALDDETHWLDTFKLGDTPVDPADYALSADISSLSKADRELTDEGELAKQLAEGVANEVAPYLVGLVDTELPVADPKTLTVKALP